MDNQFDLIVIGSGPGGQKAAIQGAKANKRVAIIERERRVGGACLHRGTIPSKTFREAAIQIAILDRYAERTGATIDAGFRIRVLREHLNTVIDAHVDFINDHFERNDITRFHGHARFASSNEIIIRQPDGTRTSIFAAHVVIATGSRPRRCEGIEIDHEFVLDSDSLLALNYLPRSMAILGSGVIASEYASIFASLGVQITMIDRFPSALGFLDPEVTAEFNAFFEGHDGRFAGNTEIESVSRDELSGVRIRLTNGEEILADKLMIAQGRIANVEGLGIEGIGLETNQRGIIDVDDDCQTTIPGIYAVGDVIGPPALASCSMEQGRRAVCHAFGIDAGTSAAFIPTGIYTIPEIGAVGLSEAQAKRKYGDDVVVGRARFNEIARGQISGIQGGLLKLVADPEGKQVLGVTIVGEGASELVTVGQMLMIHKGTVRNLIESIFNFPTLAEAYRVAALDIARKRPLTY